MLLASLVVQQQVPIVFMHSFLSYAWMMDGIINKLQKINPDWQLINCEVGNGALDTFFMSLDEQTDELSKCINNDPRTQNGFIGVGYSNGGFLMRHYLQKFNHIKAPMLRYVGLSAPAAGFFCGVESDCWILKTLPEKLNTYIHDNIYQVWAQRNLGPTAFWRDPYQLDQYKKHSSVLAHIDNTNTINETYKKNFMSVDRLVLFGSPKDGLIQPWQSAWFGVFAENSEHDVILMEDRYEYIHDTFGLRSMNEQGRIRRIDSGISHLEYMVHQKFIEELLEPELRMEL
ncbi:Palmitoyl-protein_thioesterase [Hexamita inflata]|uniref:Palmitoyl-protein thioesterase 1 n=1 Tax=Hexamita inflata TaxID=28002 RepID=A0AA86VLH9_9EUKA|nr:Palmitoyl-protein thioesterase [Hexamita inflata]